MSSENALLVFVKKPEAGRVKTRLRPQFSDQECALLYRAMVTDLVANIKSGDAYQIIFFITPPEGEQHFRIWLGERFSYQPQGEGDLGERMHHALNWAFCTGYRKAVLIGTDIPGIDQTIIKMALTELDHADIVLGPCEDGGYYLIGMKRGYPRLFQGIRWSSSSVFTQTVEKISQLELKVSILEEKSDIDSYSDAVQLLRRLESSTDGHLHRLSETYTVLRKIIPCEELS